jgi:hypothetical protein
MRLISFDSFEEEETVNIVFLIENTRERMSRENSLELQSIFDYNIRGR